MYSFITTSSIATINCHQTTINNTYQSKCTLDQPKLQPTKLLLKAKFTTGGKVKQQSVEKPKQNLYQPNPTSAIDPSHPFVV